MFWFVFLSASLFWKAFLQRQKGISWILSILAWSLSAVLLLYVLVTFVERSV